MVRTLVLSIFSCLGNLAFTPEQLPVQQVEIISTLPTSTNEISRIYFIHNAESEYSAKDEHGTKFTSGRSPMVSLSERGREQADRLGALLSSRIEQAIVFIPPAKRAEETASFLLSKSITMGLYCEGLFEVGMGDWEGKPKDQLYKTEHQKWKSLSAAEKYTTPRVTSGESYQEAAHRAIYELEGIVQENPGKTIFIISGENLLNALAIHWINPNLSKESGSDLPMLPMAKGDFFLVEIPHGQSIEQAKVKTLFHIE